MKRKHLFLAIAALLAAGGLWLARTAGRADRSAFNQSNPVVASKTASDKPQSSEVLDMPNPNPDRTLAPPDPAQRFRDFTPEQRVEFARKGHGPGG